MLKTRTYLGLLTPCLALHGSQRKNDVKNYPDSYQWERAQRFGVSQHCIQHWLNFLAISCKKNTKTPKSQRKYTYKLPE
ncbi:IS630 transposase-related protein [Piscirickettsia salmonis]|uniref:IS630 transposase-related protein n=1 Tax=Piscirickettsia salmonis TaxID=1238 RepID=UPI001E3BF8B1|nr:IS630 transposase-related protein [Piscirickettsia salmonis]